MPGFEPGTSASRTQRSTGLSHTPNKKNGAHLGAGKADRVGFEPTRQFCCPHALQACALSHSATCPNAAKKGSPFYQRRGWDGPRFARSSRSASGLARLERIPRHLPGRSSTEGVGFEPTRPFRVNALAGRRLKPLGHPSKLFLTAHLLSCPSELPRQGSNLDSSDPESDVLPVTPRGIQSTLIILGRACTLLEQSRSDQERATGRT